MLTNAQKHNQLRHRAKYRTRVARAEEGTAYGQPALKVHGKLLACLAAHCSAEPNSLVVLMDFDDRAELLDADPNVYCVTDHYVDYTSVLVRLSRVNADVLRDLLGMACKFVTRKAARRSSTPKRRMLGPGKSAVTGDVDC